MNPVVLIGCSKTKAEIARPAAALYRSHLFRLCRAYAEQLGHPWAILSAKHWLVLPVQVVEPYDLELKDLDKDYRQQWKGNVDWSLRRTFLKHWGYPGAPEAHATGWQLRHHASAIVLAGQRYVSLLPDWLQLEQPLKGLGIGERKAWLIERTT